jgi:D-beta-D-heptose 7-phosphate kinase/D-beta-D-heptose 1-phosphate adenosyltransferase
VTTSASKVRKPAPLARELTRLRRRGQRVVFTNGCFDLLHPGHVRYLRAARRLGDVLVVALNTDASVRRLKGAGRPLVPLRDRCEVIAALEAVDYVTTFGEETPYLLIGLLQPDVLVKGGDWPTERIVGADLVRARGGRVRSLPFARGYSTSKLVTRIRRANKRRNTLRPPP